MMASVIILYDIPSTLPGKCWSPNVWKTRYTLNYKGIPFETLWVEYPDIEPTCKKIGAKPTSTRDDGSPFYTVPVIHDPSTGKTISDSINIVEYLDKQYPSSPKLAAVPRTLETAFLSAHRSLVLPTYIKLVLPKVLGILDPQSAEYYMRNKFKVVSPIVPVGEERAALLVKTEEEFGLLDKWYKSGEDNGPFLTGVVPSHLDITVTAHILVFRDIYGDESSEWCAMKGWHGGRWTKLVDLLKPYQIYPL